MHVSRQLKTRLNRLKQAGVRIFQGLGFVEHLFDSTLFGRVIPLSLFLYICLIPGLVMALVLMRPAMAQ